MSWVLQRYLYHKFKNNPALTSDHSSFPVFVTGKESTTVGKFYAVHTAIENALIAGINVDAPSAQALSDISALMEAMADVDEAIEQQGLTETLKSQKEYLIFQIHGRHWAYDSLHTIHVSQVAVNLQNAYNLNQSIATTDTYEANERTVNHIRLLSLMQQSGELTEAQVSILQTIAQQDPKHGGPAVYTATGMLRKCAEPETPEQNLVAPYSEYLDHAQKIENRNVVGPIREASVMSVSPNPTSTSFVLRNPGGMSGTLILFDISGRVWLRQYFSGQESRIDLKEGTPTGVYLMRFDKEDGTCVFRKLIVQSN